MTKVDIISGFLGAGKTTFIKKLLSDVWAGEKLVLIENEFGEIGIDRWRILKRCRNRDYRDELRMHLLYTGW